MRKALFGLASVLLLGACGQGNIEDEAENKTEQVVADDISSDASQGGAGILERYSISSCSAQVVARDLKLVPAKAFVKDPERIHRLEAGVIDIKKLISTPPYNPEEKNNSGSWECVTPVSGPSLVLLGTSEGKIAGMLIPEPFEEGFLDQVAKMGPIATCVKECGGTDACYKACMADQAIATAQEASWWDQLVEWWSGD